jgi:signal transduction histidine kinase
LSEQVIVSVGELDQALAHPSQRGSLWLWLRARWKLVLLSIAGAAAAVAFWVTLDAGFLAYPGWLAVQKADFILGPIGVGLYWMNRRPGNRLGLLLVVLGLLGIPYILESSSNSTLFAIGIVAEDPIYVMAYVVILAFPSGRLEGLPERLVLALLVIFTFLVLVVTLTASHLAPGLSISGCRVACPQTALGVLSPRSYHIDSHILGALPVAIALATAGVITWRYVTGTPPRRRALAIGAPVALLFLFSEAAYRALFLFAPNGLAPSARPIQSFLQWALAATRSFIWYGFLFALIAAELFAARVLRDVVRRSLGRPSLRELESTLGRPLGDPGLRLGFWRPRYRDWVGHDGAALELPKPGQTLTEVDRDGRPAAAIVHDKQLADDPELLQAAGAAVLLAEENAELESAWKASLDQLADSRARLASAAERERRKLERDLHDGAQQRLVAATINLTLADEATDDQDLNERIADARAEIEHALSELREIAHGIYPTALARSGLGRAFDWLADRYQGNLEVTEATARRFSPEIELAMYYCGLEAVQNASKHAGPEARTSIRLYVDADQLHLEVRDNGAGFDVARVRDGDGLQNMRDRLGAVEGRVDVISERGEGTLVAVAAPVRAAPPDANRLSESNGRPSTVFAKAGSNSNAGHSHASHGRRHDKR